MGTTFATREDKQSQFQATTNVAVAGLTTVTTIPVEGLDRIGFEVKNAAGGGAIDDFNVDYFYHPDSAAYFTVATAAADYTTPNWPVLNANPTDPCSLAAAASSGVVLDVRGVYQVRIQASSAVSTANVTIQGCGL